MSEGRSRRLVRCSLGTESYCVDSRVLDSVHTLDNLYPSRSADGSIGWLRRFDEKTPVFKLADRLGKPTRGVPRDGAIIIVRGAEGAWGLLVDRVWGAVEVSPDRFRPLPPLMGDPQQGPFLALVFLEEEWMLLLEPDRVRRPPPPLVAVPPPRDQDVAAVPPGSGGAARPGARQLLTFAPPYENAPEILPRLALSASQVLEIVSGAGVAPVPYAVPFVTGLVGWRGQPAPLVDLAAALGFAPAPYRPGCRLLICRTTTGPGLLAQPVMGDVRKLRLPAPHRPWTAPLPLNRDVALGVFEIERSLHVVPDLNALTAYRAGFGQPS